MALLAAAILVSMARSSRPLKARESPRYLNWQQKVIILPSPTETGAVPLSPADLGVGGAATPSLFQRTGYLLKVKVAHFCLSRCGRSLLPRPGLPPIFNIFDLGRTVASY